jgi:hypothetical protein
MTSLLLASAVWLTRMWTRAYTWGMHPLERDARREEIESDLWESQHDEANSDAHIAGHVIVRLLGGLFDDIRWRAEHPSLASVRALVVIGTTGFIAAALWVLFLTQTGVIPVPPPPPTLDNFSERFSPPPPPPPPAPPGPWPRAVTCTTCPTPRIEVHEELRASSAAR